MTRFYKYEALGNDFVCFEGIRGGLSAQQLGIILERIPFLLDRRHGIGGDGLLLILPPDKMDDRTVKARMRIFNPDGREAEMCGNGVRAVAKLLETLGLTDGRQSGMTVMTGAGPVTVKIEGDEISVKMYHEPVVNPEPSRTEAGGKIFSYYRVDMGNPHAVIPASLNDPVFNVKDVDVARYGRAVEIQSGPSGTNVEFFEEIGQGEIFMRVWERGAGETLACGTGAAAAAGVYRKLNESCRNVIVNVLGGALRFAWKDDGFYMQGGARRVYSGEIELGETDHGH